MILGYLKIILAICLLWPRGYLLIYVIDRSKNFSFGFKFFTGWLIGIAAFTLDIFATNALGGFKLQPLVFLFAVLGQVVSLEILIFFLEKKFIFPHFRKTKEFFSRQWQNFISWTRWEKIVFVILILTVILRLSGSLWQVKNIPTYDFDAWNNWNLRAKVVFAENTIPKAAESPFYLGGGIASYPLFDSLFKVWLATSGGSWQESYINLASIFYYLFLLLIFYFSLPRGVNRIIRLVGVYLLSSLPLLYFHSQVAYADLLFSIFLFLTISCLFYWLAGGGNSFFYFSGIALAFSIWTKNEGLAIIFPILLITTVVFLVLKKCRFWQWFFYWFWGIVTISPWLYFRFSNQLDFLSGDSSTFRLVFNSQFLGEAFSSIFLRSHFNLLWLLFFIILALKFKSIWKSLALRYLTIVILVLFLFYNGVIVFTDKAYDLSALARVNLQLTPLVVLWLIFFYFKFFGRIKT